MVGTVPMGSMARASLGTQDMMRANPAFKSLKNIEFLISSGKNCLNLKGRVQLVFLRVEDKTNAKLGFGDFLCFFNLRF